MYRWLSVLLVVAIAGCGSEMESISLELNFLPRDLPAGTASLRYYVVRKALSNGSQARCEDFMGSNAPNSIVQVSLKDIAKSGFEVVSDITGVTIVVDRLPEGDYMFYLEALNGSNVLIGCGCGTGSIEKGRKTVISIRLVTDCKA